ncbi:peptide chain release factor N(5)-glutamine methyltransferase [Sporanaerobacter acetigenes]|uniref:Release factor glutamine methyltransferase n=1 Tax=Sporanaerobacter acetigenes DSM 13106 TaxID=1123281 RepID=A0A1M5SZ23_9FIRM|nr:peptide chain release factor N(5)-glutamine methyltransferase [Sporanaerobacter acetigenes]SHH43739.1 release factor glutamine methyltransferase [Sporanaerobacter acetigenes DSM 13106]
MEIKKLLERGLNILGEREYLNGPLDVILILSYLLNVDKSYIYTHGNREVSDEIVDKFLELVKKRRTGWPIAYLINEKEFYGLNFYIEEGILIPRPDTEILVDYILNNGIKNYQGKINILDLGSGSGCIGITLAYHIKKAQVYSIDIDEKALEVTRKNVEKFHLQDRVEVIKENILEEINSLQIDEKIDIIVSNPPYIPRKDIEELQIEVKDFEPRKALDGGIDGLDFYKKIIPESKKYLKSGGMLIFEIGYDQGPSLIKIFKSENYENINIIKDLQGLDRVIFGTLP